MAFNVMCCGCQRMMDKEGKASISFLADGLLNVAALARVAVDQGIAADFPDKQSADAAALKAGWSVSDSKGPNHRCPECIAMEEEERATAYQGLVEVRRGAYIEF